MNAGQILVMLNDKLPNDNQLAMQTLKNELETLNENQLNEVMKNIEIADIKNTERVFFIGGFLLGGFGVDRFMIGDGAIGSIKLGISILFVCSLCIGFFSLFDNHRDASLIFFIISFISYIALIIWYFADLSLVSKKLRNINLDRLKQIIMSVKNKG